MQRIRIMEVQVLYPRTTSMLDRCCKSKGYFLKKSCFEPQTPLEVHFGPFGAPFRRHFVHLHRPRCPPDCSKSSQQMSKSAQEASSQCQFPLQCKLQILFLLLQWRPAAQQTCTNCTFASSMLVYLSCIVALFDV